MRLLLSFLLCLFGLAGSALAGEDARFTPSGRTPDGDFDLTVELEVAKPRRLRGRIYLDRRPEGPSSGIELRRGAAPLLFYDGIDLPKRRRERSEGLRPGRHLLVARRREGPEGLASFCLELDGRVADVRYAPVAVGPAESEAQYGAGALSGARIVRLSVREVQEALFDDEFSWDSPEAGSWRAVEGDWGLATTRDAWVAVDKGPFATSSYGARPAEGGWALSLAGPERLGRVYVSVAARIPEGAEAGIAFGVAGSGPARAMRSLLVKPGPGGKGSARLLLRTGPAEPPLAGPADAYVRPGAWTRIEVWSDWDYVRAAVAGRVVLEADIADRPAGRVGVVALGGGQVLFDDFRVRPWHVLHERRPGERIRWTTDRGKGLGRPGRIPAGLVVPAIAWPLRGFRLEVRAERGPAFPVPVSPGGGARPELAAVWGRYPDEAPEAHDVSLAVDVRGPHAVAFVDGRPRSESILDRPSEGPPGIFSLSGATCGRVLLEPSRRPLEVDVFSSDFSVPQVKLPHGRGVVRVVGHVLRPASGRWRCASSFAKATEDSALRSSKGAKGGAKRGKEGVLEGTAEGLGLIRFSRPCPGDCRVEADVRRAVVRSDEGGFAQAGLFVAVGRDKAGKLERYSLSVDTASSGRPPQAGETQSLPAGGGVPTRAAQRAASQSSTDRAAQGARLVLRRIGAEVASRPVSGPEPFRIALERRGPHLLGYLAGELVLMWRDAEPLEGDEVGFFVRKGGVAFGRARITHLRATRSDFRKVDPGWQPLSGKWLLHTGLACIPWDHWITAFGSTDGPAYTGLLQKPGADVCVVARVSEAGEGFETKTHVHYPLHDISLTLRGDPEETASGYRFLIAPLPGKVGVLLFRNGREVARGSGFRIFMGGHNNQPREFTVVARAVGGVVSCSIGSSSRGRELVRWRDPDPLPAGCVILGAEKGRANFADVTVMDVSETTATADGRR